MPPCGTHLTPTSRHPERNDARFSFRVLFPDARGMQSKDLLLIVALGRERFLGEIKTTEQPRPPEQQGGRYKRQTCRAKVRGATFKSTSRGRVYAARHSLRVGFLRRAY